VEFKACFGKSGRVGERWSSKLALLWEEWESGGKVEFKACFASGGVKMYLEWTIIAIAIGAGLIAVIPTIVVLFRKSMLSNGSTVKKFDFSQISQLNEEELDKIIHEIQHIKRQRLNAQPSSEVH